MNKHEHPFGRPIEEWSDEAKAEARENNKKLEGQYTDEQIEAWEESRTSGGMDAEKAHAEARAVEARHGEEIAKYNLRRQLADEIGDTGEARGLSHSREHFIEASADKERRSVDTVLRAARGPIQDIPNANIHDGRPLIDTLSKLEPIADVNFGALEMQHLAGKLNTEVQTIEEPNAFEGKPDNVRTYNVVPLGKAGSTNFYVTINEHVGSDGKPRVFALSDQAIERAGLRIKKNTDWGSIYPSEEKSDLAQAA